jgi:soluble lytic murein transglycosylase
MLLAAPAPDLAIYSDAVLFREHVGAYLQARAQSPLAPRARLLLGLNLLKRGQAQEAASLLESTLGQLPEIDDFVAYELAEALYQAQRVEQAGKVLDKLVKSHPDADFTPLAEERLAMIAFTRGDSARAFELTNHLLSEGGDDARTVRLLMLQCDWLTKQGKKADALKIYKRIWIYYPEFDESDKARVAMKQLAKDLGTSADPSVDELLARARELFGLGRDEEADTLLLQVLSEHRKDLDPKRRAYVILRRAHSALRRKTPEIAIELCDQLLGGAYAKGNADFRHDVLKLVAKTSAQLLDFKRASSTYATLVKEAQKRADKRDLTLLQAVVMRDAGDNKAAEKIFETFTREFAGDPKVMDAHWFWGWTLFRENDFAGAQKQWHDIVDKSPQGALALRVLYWSGRVAELQQHRDLAATAYQRVAAEDPWSYYGWLATERIAAMQPASAAPAPGAATPVVDSLAPPPPEASLLIDAQLPTSNKAFARASLFWQLGLDELAARALRAVGVPASNTDALLLAQLFHLLGDDYRCQQIVRSRFAADLKQRGDPLVLQLAYPQAYASFVEVNAQRFHVPPELVWSVMRQESTFRQLAVSPANAQGLLQLIPRTAQRVALNLGEPPPPTFVQPELNIHLGTAYLSLLADSFYGHPALTAAAYNAGPLAVDHWLLRLRELPFDVFVEEIPFRETRDYVKKVMANYAAYRRLYRKIGTPLDAELSALPAASKGAVDF